MISYPIRKTRHCDGYYAELVLDMKFIPDNSRQVKFVFRRYDYICKNRQKHIIVHIIQYFCRVLAKQCERQKPGSIPGRVAISFQTHSVAQNRFDELFSCRLNGRWPDPISRQSVSTMSNRSRCLHSGQYKEADRTPELSASNMIFMCKEAQLRQLTLKQRNWLPDAVSSGSFCLASSKNRL